MRLSPLLLASLVLAGPACAAPSPTNAPAAPQGLTLDQFLSRQTERMMAADTDGDGRISKAEMLAAGKGKGKGDPEKMFDRMDINHDGYLDKDEIRAALTKRFRRMDRNGDGVLSPDERMGRRVQPATTPAPAQP